MLRPEDRSNGRRRFGVLLEDKNAVIYGGGGTIGGRGARALARGGGRDVLARGRPAEPRPYRRLLQPHRARLRARDSYGRDVPRGLRPSGGDRREDDVLDLEGGGAPHDPKGIGRDSCVRWLG